MAQSPATGDSFAKLVLTRFGFGPSLPDLAAFAKQGFPAWLEQQLAPPPGDDPDLKQRLAAAKFQINYKETEKRPGLDEMRPLQTLDQSSEALWALLDHDHPMNRFEKARPYHEVVAATLIRAAYSRYPLREAVVAFWHDHFHVNAAGAHPQVTVSLPIYDREVIRKHALGNFREFLEAVASSTAMLYYLSNHASRAGAANENYARELFELHTLGRGAYLNDRYNRWREVPGATEGHPMGYIDEDVYEAARAFTGWTVEAGNPLEGARRLPSTGRFVYVESWHDGYQKRVLGREFKPFAAAMSDGRQVLDLVATHPATARFLAQKLCRRFVGPQASDDLVTQTAAEWTRHAQAKDQIAKVIGFIARSPEFARSKGARLKRPVELAVGFVRMTGMEFTPTPNFCEQLTGAGQRLFAYPAPTGLPDEDRVFSGANALRHRWHMLLGLAHNSWQTGICLPARVLPPERDPHLDAYIARWLEAFGVEHDAEMRTILSGAVGARPSAPVKYLDEKRLATLVAMAAMVPAYQYS